MERSEPTLVPEWLRGTGSLNGSISALHLDDHVSSSLGKGKTFANGSNYDSARSSSSDRTTSYFRRSSSSNGSSHVRAYNNFGRNQRDRDWERDTYDSRSKEKSSFGEHRNRHSSDPLKNTLSSKFEKDCVRRSLSISGKHWDTWPKKISTDLGSSQGNNSSVSSGKKGNFERDFPSLVAEEVGRVPSPGLSTAIHSLPFGTSATLGAEKWTSALAEVPLSVGNNGTGSSVQQVSPTHTSVALTTSTSLNMAEAVAHGPNRSQNDQLPIGAQRLEELAIKQSRQLIPVTPTTPKVLVSMPDKQKSKVGPQQYPVKLSHTSSNSPRGALVKTDSSKASNVGKLHVLKPVRERNGTTTIVKENVSPTGGIRATSTALSAASAVSPSAANWSPPNKPVLANTDHKPVLSNLEKLPTSQARSRNDFFNLMRKKSMATCSTVSESSVANSSSVLENSTEMSPSSDKIPEMEVVIASKTPPGIDNPSNLNHIDELTSNDDASHCQNYISNDKTQLSSDPIIPDEEEAAFLRSLGWEENSDEGGLTEEEISSFYKDASKPKFLSLFNSQGGCMDRISSGLGSSEAKLES